MHEMLRDNPVYQEMTRLAREEGLEAGLQQGLQQGEILGQIQALRQMAIDIVVERFPELLRLTEENIATTSDPILLRKVALNLITVASFEEARRVLQGLSQAH